MEPDAYRRMAEIEATHWWFRGRRAIVESALHRHAGSMQRPARILEVGCGVGGNLDMLRQFGEVDAVEPDSWAVSQAQRKGIGRVLQGALPDALPEGLAPAYDIIALLDVLEHIDNAPAALAALKGRMAPGARMILTVPAYPWMFGDHDRLHHHHRRYTRSSLREELADGGLVPLFTGHFNALLLPPAALVRALQRWTGLMQGNDETRGTSGPVNGLLATLLSAERHIAPRIALPVGLSILAIAKA